MKILVPLQKKRRKGRHKNKRSKWQHHVSELLWPTIGWQSFLRFWEIRIKRMSGDPHKIALGLSLGVLVSFTPFLGGHVAIIIALCWLFSGSMVAGVIGSLVGNPWTFPLMWLWSYRFGNFVLGNRVADALPHHFSIIKIWQNPMVYWDDILLPMFVGGIISGIFAGSVVYVLVRGHIASYRKARAAFINARRQQRKKK